MFVDKETHTTGKVRVLILRNRKNAREYVTLKGNPSSDKYAYFYVVKQPVILTNIPSNRSLSKVTSCVRKGVESNLYSLLIISEIWQWEKVCSSTFEQLMFGRA